MARYVTSMLIGRTADDAFAFLSNLENAPTWDPQTVEAYKIGDGALGAGSRFCLVGSVLGRRLELPYEIQHYEPPCELVVAGETGMLRYVDRITLAPQDGAVRLTYDARLNLKGILRPGNPLLPIIFRRIGEQATRGMREAVERFA